MRFSVFPHNKRFHPVKLPDFGTGKRGYGTSCIRQYFFRQTGYNGTIKMIQYLQGNDKDGVER
jgi:hypothetical protein